jgi:hypothetical protein
MMMAVIIVLPRVSESMVRELAFVTKKFEELHIKPIFCARA